MYKPASEIAKLDTLTCVLQHFSHSSVISQEMCMTELPYPPLTFFPPFGHRHPSHHSPTLLFSNQECSSKTVVWLPRQRVKISSVGTTWLCVCLLPACKVHRLSLPNENCPFFWSWSAVTVPRNFERDTFMQRKIVYFNLPVINWKTEQNSPDGISGFHLLHFSRIRISALT